MHRPPPPAAPAVEPDLITSLLDEAIRMDPAFAHKRQRLESQLRDLFGGDRPYLRKREHPAQLAQRVRQLAGTGLTKEQIADAAGVSRSTVYRKLRQRTESAAQRARATFAVNDT